MPSFLSPLLKRPESDFVLRNARTGERLAEMVEGAFESSARNRGGPRNLDSGLSEISIVFQAAVPKLVASKYTTSGVRRPSAL